MYDLKQLLTGVYNDDCRAAVAAIPKPKTGRVDIQIIEMQMQQGYSWLRIVFDIQDFIQLTETEQYNWAGYIVKIRNKLTTMGKLVEVLRIQD